MIITNLKMNDTNVSLERKYRVFQVALDDYYALKDIMHEMDNKKTFEDSIALIPKFEEITLLNFVVLDDAVLNGLGSTPAIRRRLLASTCYYKDLVEELEPCVEAYIPLSDSDFERVFKLVRSTLGQLACYIGYQFDLDQYFNMDIDDFENQDIISDVLDRYMSKGHTGKDILQLSRDINETIISTHPYMGVFEKYPDLLEPFCEVAGEYTYDCVDMSINDIKDVLDGNVDIKDLLEKLDKE